MARVLNKQVTKGVEVHTDLAPEEIRDKDLDKLAGDEAFFNELVTVELAESTNENDPSHVVLSVNGINQPIWRGQPTIIKRKYVEVLAHMWETKYSQPTRDMGNPEAGNSLIGRSALAYPFQVIEDKNPIGRTWLKRLLEQRA